MKIKKIIICLSGLVLSALFYSCEEILMEDELTDKDVVLVAPSDNAQFFSTTVSFTWEDLDSSPKYRLQIARPNFENPIQIIADTLLSSNSYSSQLNIGEYEWRVRAENSYYSTPYKSRFFVIINNEDFQNNTVQLHSPSNNLATNAVMQRFAWQEVLGASGYQIQVFDSSNLLHVEENLTNIFFEHSFADGSYTWRVRATNGNQNTLFSARNILIDSTPPAPAILIKPANSSTVQVSNVEFQWSRSPVSGSSESDSIYIFSDASLLNLKLKSQVSGTFNTELEPGRYYWRIKSFDAAGNSNSQGPIFNFIREN